jgi:alpha-glucosidase (family GH31 glycosyl hydrolase)
MSPFHASPGRLIPLTIALSLAASWGCGDETIAPVPPTPVTLASGQAQVVVTLDPFVIRILDADGKDVLTSLTGSAGDAYGGPAATVDTPYHVAQSLPGWDGYAANEAPWRRATSAKVTAKGKGSATFALDSASGPLSLTLQVDVVGPRVHLKLDARESAAKGAPNALNKSTIGFHLGGDEHFFGLGERFTAIDHRGLSLYSWAEEGGLALGESEPPGGTAPLPNGPSMTYFPVPFFLSSHGYAVHLATTFRTEVHLGSERDDAWRFAVNAPSFEATVYVEADPLAAIADYTEDTGHPISPAPWVFGPRRRVNRGAMIEGVPETVAMRKHGVAVTGVDDALHFLPASNQVGIETEVAAWTQSLHDLGYKAMSYNNPYVAESAAGAAVDYAFGKEHGYFVKNPQGEPYLTEFISGKLLRVAAVDLTNPDAVTWFQSLLQRSLDLGYDGWMHDFGEYIPRDAVLFDGRSGEEVHNEYPVLSAKAAHDLLEKQRPGDYLFFVRSGYSGTQKYIPATWGGDAETSFDQSQGLPSTLRAGLNLSMSGVPYWGSDMAGFKCLTADPHDKEVYLRWIEFGSVTPIMMEQDACSNPLMKQTKWGLWSDANTTETAARYYRLHTRLQPYFLALAAESARSGRPITLHPFLLHPKEPEAWKVDGAYYLGASVYVAPVVGRGQTTKHTWLPPGRYVDFDDHTVYEGGKTVDIPAPLDKLPLLLVADTILPLWDATLDTLAKATDPAVVTLAQVGDRLDAVVALSPGGHARMVLADGTVLDATRVAKDQGNPGALTEVAKDAIAGCSSCFNSAPEGGVTRLRVNGTVSPSAALTIEDVQLTVSSGPARRVRWDVLRLP